MICLRALHLFGKESKDIDHTRQRYLSLLALSIHNLVDQSYRSTNQPIRPAHASIKDYYLSSFVDRTKTDQRVEKKERKKH